MTEAPLCYHAAPMRDFKLRRDLKRVVIDGFAMPLGIAHPAPAPGSDPPGSAARGTTDPSESPPALAAPMQGYTISYTPAEEDDSDTYAFHIVVSHERLPPLIDMAFDLLPDAVYPIVEIGSRDAYRSLDVYLGEELISRREFLETWRRYEDILLEDVTIGAGANSEEPLIEIFLDEWKGLSIHVPLHMREEVETMLNEFGLEEVIQTWPIEDEDRPGESAAQVRPVLDAPEEIIPDLIDELLLNLRHEWRLELNIDPESNVDEKGRSLGMTLWLAVLIVESESAEDVAYASIWATAGSLAQVEQLLAEAMAQYPQWHVAEIFTIDRVAYDERPDELATLAPRRDKPEVHLVAIEPWPDGDGENGPSGQREERSSG